MNTYTITFYDKTNGWEHKYLKFGENKEKALETYKNLKKNKDLFDVRLNTYYQEIETCCERTDKNGLNFTYNILFDSDENIYILEYFYCWKNNSDEETMYEEEFDTLEELKQFVKEM